MASTVWRGQLTFGLVSMPVRLFRAARKERVRMHYLRGEATPAPRPPAMAEPEEAVEPPSATLPRERPAVPDEEVAAPPAPVTRLRQGLFVEGADQEPVARQEVVKGYEYAPQQYVVLGNEELRRLRPKTSPEMQILRSVRLEEIDPVYFETSYYVVPDAGGEHPYTLLYVALRKSGHVALAKVAMHGREHIVLIRPGRHGLLAHTMYFEDEIRAEDEFRAPANTVGGKELELATAFIDALRAPFEPGEFKDTYREQVRALVEGKLSRNEVAAEPAAPKPAPKPAPDIMEALKKSLALAKKPVKAAEEAAPRKREKVAEIAPGPKRRKA